MATNSQDSGMNWRQLKVSDLNYPEQDERSSNLIRSRCEAFEVSKQEVIKFAVSGRTTQEAVQKFIGDFDQQMLSESQLITSYINSLPSVVSLKQNIQELKEEISAMPFDQKFTSGKSVTNIPKEEKQKQYLFSFFALLAIVADVTNFTNWWHDHGMTWFHAFLIPFGAVVILSALLKAALEAPKHERPTWIKPAKTCILIFGILFLIAWGVFAAIEAGIVNLPPPPPNLDGTTSKAVDYTTWMQICSFIGMACAGAYLFAKAQDITDRFTDFDGITESQKFIILNKQLAEVTKAYEKVADRRTPAEGLLSMIDNTRDNIRTQVKSYYSEYQH